MVNKDWIITDQNHIHIHKPKFKAVSKFHGIVITNTREVCSCGDSRDGWSWDLSIDPDYDFDWKPIE